MDGAEWLVAFSTFGVLAYLGYVIWIWVQVYVRDYDPFEGRPLKNETPST